MNLRPIIADDKRIGLIPEKYKDLKIGIVWGTRITYIIIALLILLALWGIFR